MTKVPPWSGVSYWGVVNFSAGSACKVDILSEESGIVPEDFSHSAKIRRASPGTFHAGNSLPTGSGQTRETQPNRRAVIIRTCFEMSE